MIDLLKLAENLRDQADDYATASEAAITNNVKLMHGTAATVLYGLSIALLRTMKDPGDE